MQSSLLNSSAQPTSSKKLILLSIFLVVGALCGFMLYSSSSSSLNLRQQNKDSNIPTYVYDAFSHWSKKYGRRYTTEEKTHRLSTFYTNVLRIQAFEAENPNTTSTVGLNKFADLSATEFKELYLTLQTRDSKRNYKYLADGQAAAVDWRTKGAVSNVKDQAQCGSCWAFSAVGSLEGLYFQQSGKLVSFSPQQLVDCSQSFGNQGCNGGLMDSAFEYTAQYGIESDGDYGYTATDNTCKYDASKVVFKNKGYADVPSKNNAQLAIAVAKQPVSVAVEADQTGWQLYTGGVLSAACGTNLDHGVLAVGYGTEGSQDYWIVKNSWSATWGESGYIRLQKIATTGAGQCGIALAASYPN